MSLREGEIRTQRSWETHTKEGTAKGPTHRSRGGTSGDNKLPGTLMLESLLPGA